MKDVEIKDLEIKAEETKDKKPKDPKKPKEHFKKPKPIKNKALGNFMEHRNKIRKASGLPMAYTEAQIKECK